MTSEENQSPAEALSHIPNDDDAKSPESAPVVQPVVQVNDQTQDALETENLIESYQIIGEWIRFADAKSAAVLAINGALAGVLIPTLREYLQSGQPHPATWWTSLVTTIFVAWLASLIWSCCLAFRCILPYSRRGQHPSIGHADHFHPAAIARAYPLTAIDEYVRQLDQLGMAGLKREISVCMLVDSHISNAKYIRVARSIRMLAFSAVFGLLYLLAIQF